MNRNSHTIAVRPSVMILKKFFDKITTETQIAALYQDMCPRHGYAEWVAETCYHSNTTFVTKYAHITLPHLCGTKQGSSFAYSSSNCVASFKSRTFFPPPTFAHPPIVRGYIQSYCDDDKRYIAAVILPNLIFQVQWSLDRARDFPSSLNLGKSIKSARWISSITH